MTRQGHHLEEADPWTIETIDAVQPLPGGRFDITFSYAVGRMGRFVDSSGTTVYRVELGEGDQRAKWLLSPYPEDPALPWRVTSMASP